MIDNIFSGEYETYIECQNVDYKSVKTEKFHDLQLQVLNCANIYQSLSEFIKVEELNGDNQYLAGIHGKQDASKGMRFLSFPNVLFVKSYTHSDILQSRFFFFFFGI